MGELVTQSWHGNPRALRARDRRPGEFEAYVPHPVSSWQPMLPADTAAFIAEAENELRTTATELHSSVASGGLFFWSESLGSSRIEGVMPATRQVVHALVRRQHSPGHMFHDAATQVIGNIEATDDALAMLADRSNVTLQSLLDAHRTLMASSPTPRLGGVIRADQNWIGGNDWHPLDGDFVPPPPDRCAALLGDLIAYLRSDDHSPLLQAAIAHIQFETIHPFGDGNGRTGRAVLYGVLKQRCAPDGTMPPVSLALSRNKDAYLASLAAYQSYLGGPDDRGRSEALGSWLEVLAAAVHQSCAAVRNYQHAMGRLQQHWRAAVGGRRGRAIAEEIINLLPSRPSLSASLLSELTGYSRARCADALRRLEAIGIVRGRRVKSAAGLRTYDADRVLDAYEVMASTIYDIDTASDDYAQIIEHPLIAAEQPDRGQGSQDEAAQQWARCPLQVTSTGRPCSLPADHDGACRHLAHRQKPPRTKQRE